MVAIKTEGLNINKYWGKDINGNEGYIDDNNGYYENALDFIQCYLFGFCICGNPELNVEYVKKGLKHISQKCPYDYKYKEEFNKWMDNWEKEGIEIFGNKKSKQFFLYWATNEGFIEHGSSIIGSWLTDEGEELLKDLSIIVKEIKEEEGVN